MAEKFKFSTFVTPKGIAKYAWLDKPDKYQLERGKTQYSIRVLIEDTEKNREWVEKVLATTKAEAAKAKVKLKKQFNTPFRLPEDQDEDDFVPADGKDKPKYDEDHKGRIFFEIKTGYIPAQFGLEKDDDGNLIGLPEGTRIMSGDKVKVKFRLNPYDGLGSGVSFRLMSVQLVEKNSNFSGGKQSADEFEDDDDDDQFDGNSDDDGEIPF
jgi:hypothetical protein